jgi:probable addiction module antidote protein
MRLKSFDEYLYRELQDQEFAAAYLEDAISDSLDEFLVALRKVVQANGGMSRCAEDAQLSREAMYRMLTEKGNPVVRSLDAILRAHGMQLSVKMRESIKSAV